MHDTIVKRAKKRADDCGEAVLTRFGNSKDLVAQGAVYHSTCMADFKLNDPNDPNSDVSRRRPPNKSYFDAFKRFCVWLEDYGKSEVYSVRELHQKNAQLNDGVGYCLKSFQKKLKSHYKDHVYFVKKSGCKGELVCFNNMVHFILRDLKGKGTKRHQSSCQTD